MLSYSTLLPQALASATAAAPSSPLAIRIRTNASVNPEFGDQLATDANQASGAFPNSPSGWKDAHVSLGVYRLEGSQ